MVISPYEIISEYKLPFEIIKRQKLFNDGLLEHMTDKDSFIYLLEYCIKIEPELKDTVLKAINIKYGEAYKQKINIEFKNSDLKKKLYEFSNI